MLFRIPLAFALVLSSTPCVAETISTLPPNPSSHDSVTVIVSGTTANVFQQPALFGVAVNGTNIRVDICFVSALVPGPADYQIAAPVGILTRGAYQIDSYHASCALSGTGLIQLTTPQLSTTAALSVSAVADAIPAMSNIGLMIVVVLLFVAGSVHLLRRHSARKEACQRRNPRN